MRRMARRHDPSARLAQRCISNLLGVDVERWDVPPREGAYDLRYERRQRTVAVEVKSLVSPTLRAAEAEAMKTGYLYSSKLSMSWTVYLEHSASWKAVRLEAESLLTELEALGWRGGGDFWRIRHAASTTWSSAIALGVESAWPSEPTAMHPPGFYLMPSPWGGGVPGIDALPGFCDHHLASEEMSKLRRQLARADTDERHAFFVVGWSHMIISALSARSESLPATAPELVNGVDGIWVTPTTTDGRVLAWLPGEGWLQGLAPTK